MILYFTLNIMIKTKIVWIEELEIYLNKPWYTFLCSHQDNFVFKYKEETSKQLVTKTKTEKFFDMFINKEFDQQLLLDCLPEHKLSEEILKQELVKFINYWIEKNDNWTKRKWQKQNTFEITARLRTWFSNVKIQPNKWVWITEI